MRSNLHRGSQSPTHTKPFSLEEVKQLPFFNLGRPREEVDEREVRARERREDGPEAPDAAPLARTEVEAFEVLVAVAPDADFAGVRGGGGRVEQLRGCRKGPWAGVRAAGLAGWGVEGAEVGSGAVDGHALGDGHGESAEGVGEGVQVVELIRKVVC